MQEKLVPENRYIFLYIFLSQKLKTYGNSTRDILLYLLKSLTQFQFLCQNYPFPYYKPQIQQKLEQNVILSGYRKENSPMQAWQRL